MHRGTLAIATLASLGLVAARADDRPKAEERPKTDAQFKREGDPKRRALIDMLEWKEPPDLRVENWIQGEPTTFKKLRGSVVLVEFWGNWEGPCLGAVPQLKKLHERFGPKGLVILGMHTQLGKESVAETVKELAIPFLVAVDSKSSYVDKSNKKSNGETIDAFGVDSYPDYYVVDRAGRLRFADLQNAEIDRAIEYLIAEPPPPPKEGEGAESAPASKPAKS